MVRLILLVLKYACEGEGSQQPPRQTQQALVIWNQKTFWQKYQKQTPKYQIIIFIHSNDLEIFIAFKLKNTCLDDTLIIYPYVDVEAVGEKCEICN